MKGILLAGGTGSRLWPTTKSVSKQLLPVFNKPMIYYSLSTLLLAGIKEILVINAPDEQAAFKKLLGNGTDWGIHIHYAVQEQPRGIAEAFLIAEEFLAGSACALVLGDNLFYGENFSAQLRVAKHGGAGATVFVHAVADPQAYGVIVLDERGEPVKIVEKPTTYISPYAVTGLYFYDAEVVTFAKVIKPSARGELEITDVNNLYLSEGKLRVEKLGRGSAWLDTGTPGDLLDASNFVQTIENRQGFMIACPEEICFRNGWIDEQQLMKCALTLSKTAYGRYLESLARGEKR